MTLLNEDEIYEIQNEVTCELWHTEFLGEVDDLTKAIAKAQAELTARENNNEWIEWFELHMWEQPWLDKTYCIDKDDWQQLRKQIERRRI